MIVPCLGGEAFLADVAAARHAAEGFCLWWLGQSGFLVQWQDQHLLFDPYLSDSLTQKYADTDKPHIRMSQRVVDPVRLDFIDVVTSSHNHTDHLDGPTLTSLRRVNPRLKIVVPAANREFAAERLGVPVEQLEPIDAGTSFAAGNFQLHGVPAAHESVDRDAQGRYCYLGLIARFGPWTIYHSGDTMLFPGLQDWLSPWNIDVALLPINGRAPERRVAGNLWGREAAHLAADIGARCVIPCHYDMFTFNTASPDEFVTTARELGQPFRVLQLGERFEFK